MGTLGQRWARTPTCHPDRPHKAYGLCRQCYERSPRRRERRAEQYATWASGNPDYHADKHLRKKYQITLAEYNALLERQGGCCAICRCDQPGGRGRFHVDHDHRTGTVRGLLCRACNMAIGALGERPDVLRSAADYLESRW